VVDSGTLPHAAKLLRNGLLPIYHGDVVLDSAQRCAIFSGDKILYW
jgi:isopentenyl phosphate kinase